MNSTKAVATIIQAVSPLLAPFSAKALGAITKSAATAGSFRIKPIIVYLIADKFQFPAHCFGASALIWRTVFVRHLPESSLTKN
jgi:hypothetical protein